MARTKNEKTPIQTAAEKAKEAYKKAKETADKPGANDTAKKAAVHAKEKMQEAVAAENRERFETVGARRVTKALAAINLLKTIANLRGYKFDAADVQAMNDALSNAVSSANTAFEAALTGKTETKAEGGFSFAKK